MLLDRSPSCPCPPRFHNLAGARKNGPRVIAKLFAPHCLPHGNHDGSRDEKHDENHRPAGRRCGRARGNRQSLPRRRSRSRERHAGGGVEDVRRRSNRAGDSRRRAAVRREPSAGGQGQISGAEGQLPGHRIASGRPAAINKAKEAVALFDAIHRSIGQASPRHWPRRSPGRRPPLLFVQIDTGEEAQKSGVLPETRCFYRRLPRPLGREISA